VLVPIFVLALALSCSSSGGGDDDAADDDQVDDDQTDDDATDDDSVDDDAADDDADDDASPDCTQTVVRGNLEWSMCDNGADTTHDDAASWVAHLELGGKNDWRLPTIQELQALYDESREIATDCYIPAHIVDPFVLTCVWVWSSGTVIISGEQMAMAFGFSHGSTAPWGGDVSSRMRALAVRDMP
jgi:hypothetical protein